MLNALRSFACWHHCFSVHLLKRGVYDFAPWCRSGGLSVGRSVYQPFFPITWKHMYTYSDLRKWHLLVFMSMGYMLRSQWPFMPKWILTNNVTRHKILDLKTCALVWNTAWHLLIFLCYEVLCQGHCAMYMYAKLLTNNAKPRDFWQDRTF